MKGTLVKRWTVLSGVLGIGMLIGLVLAGSWNVTPSGLASLDEGAEGPRHARGIDETPGTGAQEPRVPPALLRSPPTPAPAVGVPSTREAAARVRPAVVSVEVIRFREGGGGSFDFHFDMPGFPEQFRELLPRRDSEQREPERVRGLGSGFIISGDGYIITNNHVVNDAAEVQVTLPDNRQFKAEVVGTDPLTDVAVIRIMTDEDLPVVELGDSESIQIGDWVLAIGNPLEFNFTVTAGIVSAKGRNLRGLDPQNLMIQNFIQTDAVINRGNSGGPLVDLEGRVVGINTAIAAAGRTGLSEGYGFAIPMHLARSVAADLIRYGEVRRGYLGITFHEIDAVWARAVSLPHSPPVGVVVQTVVPGGAAERGGVRPEDVILEINGVTIKNSGELQTMVSTLKPGTVIEVVIYRGGTSDRVGQRRTLQVTLQERPREQPVVAEERPREPATDRLGMELRELERGEARRAGFDGRGLVITRVERHSPSDIAGLVPGLIILQVDGRATPDLKSYQEAVGRLESGDAVLLRVYQPGRPEGDRERTIPITVR